MNPLSVYDFEENNSWEYNLLRKVRWDSTDKAKNDVLFYVKAWLDEIAKQEGYKLVKDENSF